MKGIIEVTRGGLDLSIPPNTPSGEAWVYGLAFPCQIAPREAALFVNIRKDYAPTGDFEVGTDVILFDDLSNIRSDSAIPISRNHEEPDPDTGEPSVMVKYPVIGGFVPLGAKRADGSPHPHAGTGFGVSSVCSFPLEDSKKRYMYKSKRSDLPSPQFRFVELYQFAFDGEIFRILSKDRISHNHTLSKWKIQGPGLMSAIPDEDDLLFALRIGDAGSGVMRWSRDEKSWRPVSFSPVKGAESTSEPSLIRDADGALLFCARWERPGYHDERRNAIRVWRSYDGASWEQVVNVNRIRSESPVTLNKAADGTPYVTANLYQEDFIDPRGIYSYGRENLFLWPLNDERTGIKLGIAARPSRADFGHPPNGTYWVVDHPIAATVQLADGAWHNVLAYRVAEEAEVIYSTGPTPQTGCYVEEVISKGKPLPSWNF